ncbi:MAG: NADH:flavin oxidoreductase [Sneathiellales bacterium]|nr:NADH:flavin oxidoreductase [Sneathiellales bacterium]
MTSHLALKPFSAGKLSLTNRSVVAPMSRVSTLGDGIPTKAMADYYARFAKGGFGMIITEGTYTDRHFSQAYPNQPGITDGRQLEGWKHVIEKVKMKETPVILQLMHAGALSQHLTDTRAPSAIEPLRTMLAGYSMKQGRFPRPQSMNLAEIDQVIEGFVLSAQRAQEAGFDGIEIHSANGYLLDQFITDYTNMREDQYGGPLENRLRLTCQIIKKIRQYTQGDFVVGVRLSQGKVNDFDYLWANGLEDGKIIFQSIADAGADYIHFASEGKGFDHGCLTREGKSLPKLAKDLTGLPVIANGGLHIPEEAQRILQDEHADLIALGTGALSNPDWPLKLEKQQEVLDFDPAYFADGVAI